MSSGARQNTYLIPEVTPGITPTSGAWDTLRLTSNTLSPTVSTQVSDEITESRISQGSVATGVEIAGDLVGELSYGSFDKLLEAAFYGDWTANVLTVGSARKTFTVAKNFSDVDVYTLFKGMHVSVFALDIPSDGKVTATFTLAGLDYADSAVNSVGSTNPPTTTPFMSNINVGTLKIDGESMEGIACVSAISMSLDNSLQAQRCIGTDKLGPGAQIATEAAITGSLTLAWSNKSWSIWKNTFSRKTIAVEFPIIDSVGNRYTLNLPSIEVDGDLPNGGKRDLIEVTLNYTVSKLAPTITRAPYVAPTSVAVAPPTATIAVAGTQQLAATVSPAGAPQDVIWTSSAPSKATVSSTGLVTGVASGSATITATSKWDGTKLGTSTITVS